jgi:hypothetical protein
MSAVRVVFDEEHPRLKRRTTVCVCVCVCVRVRVCQDNTEAEVEAYLRRKYEGSIANAVVVDKEDLDLKNHLTGLKRPYLKVSFSTQPV